MSRDPLPALLRIRQIALDDARHALAECLAKEAAAESAMREAARTIEREADAARALSAGDGAVEAFAAWLPGARHRSSVAEAAARTAAADTMRARAELTLARASVEATATLLERQTAERRAAEARKDQMTLDDIPRPGPTP